ncbi:MAG: hypothetical protein MJY79_07620 [Bacteroidaceae bacterium]|nr:hypothetical protein [Bacteroidaceae bacterium]
MNCLRKIILGFALLASMSLAAADVIVESSIDSLQIWVGEQTQIHIGVTCDAGQRVDFPLFSDTIITGLEILHPVKTDTVYLDKKKRMTVTRNYTVTSFDSTLYYIPPFQVYVDSVPYSTNQGLALAVYMFDVDSQNPDAFFGPKDIMPMPLSWKEIRKPLLLLLGVILLAILAVSAFISLKNDKPIIHRIKVVPKIPAHEKALQEIERIRTEKLSHSEDSKGYYTALTDVIRVYMNDRYGINATEMTSQEILDSLKSVQDPGMLVELKDLLQTADLVKFAKFKPLLNENDQNLVNAMEFVNKTKIEEVPEKEPEKETVVVETRRSKKQRILIGSVIGVASVAAAVILYYLVVDIIYLFF